jgi:hypothetical protein
MGMTRRFAAGQATHGARVGGRDIVGCSLGSGACPALPSGWGIRRPAVVFLNERKATLPG